MGTRIVEEKELYAALNSCAFISTAGMTESPAMPFVFMMDHLMLGVGVGFDTKGAGVTPVYRPHLPSIPFPIPDSREGWCSALQLLLESYLVPNHPAVHFDYSLIRPAGSRISTFGGLCPGYQPIQHMLDSVAALLKNHVGQLISTRDIVDIMNIIGTCVVSGNLRRSAQIAFGDHSEHDYLNLKNYNLNPDRALYGWTSNNSVYAQLGMDYTDIINRIVDNGEPGTVS